MIAPREQRSARRAADRGRVEAVVTQAARGEFVERGCRHRTAEGADLPEAHVVQQNDDNVWCTGGWRWNPGPVHFGLQIRLADLAAKRQFRQGELRAVTICFNVRFLGCHGVLSLSNAVSARCLAAQLWLPGPKHAYSYPRCTDVSVFFRPSFRLGVSQLTGPRSRRYGTTARNSATNNAWLG